MNLPVWPEYYRNRAEEYQISRIIFGALFAAGIVLEILMLFFKWDYCLVLGFCLIAFAICGWIQCAWERKNVLLEINLEETLEGVKGTALVMLGGSSSGGVVEVEVVFEKAEELFPSGLVGGEAVRIGKNTAADH